MFYLHNIRLLKAKQGCRLYGALLMTTFLVGCSEPPNLKALKGYAFKAQTYQSAFGSEDAISSH